MTCPGHDVKLLPHRVKLLSNRVYGIWPGIGEGAKQVSHTIRLPAVALV